MPPEDSTLLTIFKIRDAMAVAAVVEGLQFMIQDAHKGDQGARQTLAALAKALQDVADLQSPLTVVRQ